MALGLDCCLLRRGRCRSGDHGRRRHRVRSHGSGLQRRRGDGRPLPPAGDLRPARRARRWTRSCPLGDIQYDSATTARINAVYAPTWGRVKSISRPILGNHESSGCGGYFDYFNGPGVAGRAGRPSRQGLLQLRRRRLAPGRAQLELLERVAARPARSRRAGCEPTSPPIRRAARSPTGTTRASARGTTAATTFMQPLWEALQDAQAELVLSGHSHDYERFAPLDRDGEVDQARRHPPVRGGHRRRVLHGRLGHAGAAQRGRPERHVRRPQAHASPDELRLAVRPRRGRRRSPIPDRRPATAWSLLLRRLRRVGRGWHGPGDHEAPARATPDPAQEPSSGTSSRRRPRSSSRSSARPRAATGRSGKFTQFGAAGANERRFRAKIRSAAAPAGDLQGRACAPVDAAGNRSAAQGDRLQGHAEAR